MKNTKTKTLSKEDIIKNHYSEMGKKKNAKHPLTSEKAREMQKKSVEARKAKKDEI